MQRKPRILVVGSFVMDVIATTEGLPAYSVFIVHLVIEITAQFARLLMLKRMIKLSLREYFRGKYFSCRSVKNKW